MVWLKRIGVAIVVVILLFILIGFLLPSEYGVERTIVIETTPEAIHSYVGDLTRWPEWIAWVESDPTLETTLGDITQGVGAHQSWAGESGSGELTMTQWNQKTGIVYDMSLEGGRYESIGAIRYQRAPEGTRVTWTMTGDMGMNLFGRYFGLMMDPVVGTSFERGLEKLKLAAETTANEAPPGSAEETSPSGDAESSG